MTEGDSSNLDPRQKFAVDLYISEALAARFAKIDAWVKSIAMYVGLISAVGIGGLVWAGYKQTIASAEIAAKETATIVARNTTTLDLSERISKNAEFIKAVADAAAFPEGTIIIFSPKLISGQSSKGLECPKGWQLFHPAVGRFVVGAGRAQDQRYASWYMGKEETVNRKALKEYDLLASGGEEYHLLTMEELPAHSHTVYPHAGLIVGKDGRHPGAGSEDPHPTSRTNGRTEEIGGGKPHNNLPPFVALHYCIKGASDIAASAQR